MKPKQYFSQEEHALVCRECGEQEPIPAPINLHVFFVEIEIFVSKHKDCERNLYRPLSDG
jgi:hypothetical protein